MIRLLYSTDNELDILIAIVNQRNNNKLNLTTWNPILC